jgi:subtilisin family serine protease
MRLKKIFSSFVMIFAVVLSSMPIAKAVNNSTPIMLTVVMKGNQVPSDFSTYVKKNGGKIIKQIPEIGVVQIQGAASLIPIIQSNTQVKSVGPSIKMSIPKTKTMVLQEGMAPSILKGSLTLSNQPGLDHQPPPDPGVIEPDLYNSLQWDIKEVTHNGMSFKYNKGSHNVVVGIIDTGIDTTHPDLTANLLGGTNFVPANDGGDSTETGNPDDINDRYGHGTHVAGTIAGNGRILGVAPGIGIKAYRVFGASGSTDYTTIAKAIIAATNENVNVISMSLGGYYVFGQIFYTDPSDGKKYSLGNEVADFQIYKRAVKYAIDHGVTVVAAAGNDALNITNKADVTSYLNNSYASLGYQFVGASFEAPGSMPGVITVSATGPGDTLASYSNYGSGFVDVTAPGGDFQRLNDEFWYLDMNFSAYPGGYAFMAGTSMATPKVSAVAALLIAQYGNLGPQKIAQLVSNTAQDIGKLGKDDLYGNGMVQAPFKQEQLAKELDWHKEYGGLSWEDGRDALQTKDGGYVMVGNTASYGHVKNDQDIYVIKTGRNGQVEWRRMLGSNYTETGEKIIETKDGGYLIVGGSKKDDSEGYYDFYVSKLTSDGTIVWEKTIGEKRAGETGVSEIANSVVETKDGGYIISGDKNMDGKGNNIYLVKLDGKGNQIWDKIYSGEAGISSKMIKQTIDGGYIVAGKALSNDASQYYNFYLLKIDAAGNESWHKSFGYGNNLSDSLENVLETPSGDLVIAGNSESSDYDQYGMLVTTSNMYYGLIGKNGEQKWGKLFNDNTNKTVKSLVRTSDGNYMAVGYKEIAPGNQDVLLCKISPNGERLSEKTYGGANNDLGFSIENTKDGGYVVFGSTGSITAGGQGDTDYYLMKFNSLLEK